jgi:hypothetical protein
VKKCQDVSIIATVTLTIEAIYLMTMRTHAYACVFGTFRYIHVPYFPCFSPDVIHNILPH